MEAVVLASGPSLTVDDVVRVWDWREAKRDSRFIVVANLTFKACPSADFMFAMDDRFWRHYGAAAEAEFKGERYGFGMSPADNKYCKSLRGKSGFQTFGNSGAGAVMLAKLKGAKRIILLGFDCQKTGGKAHWHADYGHGLGNASSVRSWPMQFFRLRGALKGIEVINASRETLLTFFPRKTLEEALQ